MRPQGEICTAMVKAWSQGPATVTQAAHRACVGVSAARYTASRMVSRGQLVVVSEGRPAVLAVPPSVLAQEFADPMDTYFHALRILGSKSPAL